MPFDARRHPNAVTVAGHLVLERGTLDFVAIKKRARPRAPSRRRTASPGPPSDVRWDGPLRASGQT